MQRVAAGSASEVRYLPCLKRNLFAASQLKRAGVAANPEFDHGSSRPSAFVKSVFDPPVLGSRLNFYLTGLVIPRKDQGHSHSAFPIRIWAQMFLVGVRPHDPTALGLLHIERLSFGRHSGSSNSVRTAFSRWLLIGKTRRVHLAGADGAVNGKLFTSAGE